MHTQIFRALSEQAAIRSMADILAYEATPWQETFPAPNTYDLLRRACERHPQRTALRFILTGEPDAPDFAIDYRTLMARVNQAANAFHRAGIRPGKAVALLLPNLPQTHFAMLGAQAAGIVNPINPFLDVDFIAGIVAETGADAIVALGPMPHSDAWEKAVEAADRCPSIRTVFMVTPARYLSPGNGLLLKDLFARARKPTRDGVRIVDFDTALESERDDALASGRVIAETDVCSYFHTGGTTGLPKVATHLHRNEAFVASMVGVLEPRANVLLCGLPLFHVNGAMVTGLAAFHAGSEVVMLTPAGYRGPNVMQNFWKLIERFRATSFSAVPTIFGALADLPLAGADISSLRYAFVGAAPLPLEVAHRFEAITGVPLCEGYGLTEGACVSSCNPPLGERRLGTVGLRLPHQQIQAFKVDENGNAIGECAPGQAGVLGICGPNVFPGYLREADNQGIWLKPGWLNTGDLGYVDGDGYVRLTGRAKELIIRGGHNIDPAMIEEALQKHPAVTLAAAVGQPDAHAGELPIACVTLKTGASATPEELAAYARNMIPERAAVPVRIDVLDQMPLTAVGKVAKTVLRLQAAEHVFRSIFAEKQVRAQVRVCQDRRYSSVAEVTCNPQDESRVRELLAPYSIYVRFVASTPSST